MKFSDFLGRVITGVDVSEEEVIFRHHDGSITRVYHQQDCCEMFTVDQVVGDITDLFGETIVEAEQEVYPEEPYPGYEGKTPSESYTWTLHRFKTSKGTLEIRYLGESNGYYSEHADYEFVDADGNRS